MRAVETKRQPASQEGLLPAWHFPVCNDFSKVCGILRFLSRFLHPCKYVPPYFSYHFGSFLCTASHTTLSSAPEDNAIASVCISKAVLWEVMRSSLLTMLASMPFPPLLLQLPLGHFLWLLLPTICLSSSAPSTCYLIFPNAKEAIYQVSIKN